MNKRRTTAVFLVFFAIFSAFYVSRAMVMTDNKGRWPDTWPKELDSLRDSSKTLQVGTGIQEDVYEIPFDTRETFESAWPHILTLKSRGAPLTLEKSPSKFVGESLTAGVRVRCPATGSSVSPDGKELKSGPPWPESIQSKSGELPEYVVSKNGKWVPYDGKNRSGFMHRARVEVVLVVDGEIVDLNRIPLPPDTPIIDKRF